MAASRRCTWFGSAESGTDIDKNVRTIYVQVPAHRTKVIRDFNMGLINNQVARTGCYITDFAME